jgi:hypothetical protein
MVEFNWGLWEDSLKLPGDKLQTTDIEKQYLDVLGAGDPLPKAISEIMKTTQPGGLGSEQREDLYKKLSEISGRPVESIYDMQSDVRGSLAEAQDDLFMIDTSAEDKADAAGAIAGLDPNASIEEINKKLEDQDSLTRITWNDDEDKYETITIHEWEDLNKKPKGKPDYSDPDEYLGGMYPDKKEDLSMWQKIGKHFAENADKRDQLFSMLGSMGRELVKPIEPGKAAAGALVPTLSRGMEKGEAQWAAKESARAESTLKRAEALQKMNPMQYMTNNMKDAAAYVSGLGIDPNTAKGRAEISKYLVTVGVSPAIVSMQEALTNAEEALQLYMMGGQVDEAVVTQKKLIITNYRNKLNNMLEGSLGGSAVTQSTYDDDLYVAGAQPNSLKATTLETINKGEFIPG